MSFNGYFSEKERSSLIRDALANVSTEGWKVVPRQNPASEYPSDFSLIEVGILYTETVHKTLMRRVLSDRYRITQEKFQHRGV